MRAATVAPAVGRLLDTMRWEVKGADAATGQDAVLSIEAPTAREAENLARYNGMLVSSVTPERPTIAGFRASTSPDAPVLDYRAPTTPPLPPLPPPSPPVSPPQTRPRTDLDALEGEDVEWELLSPRERGAVRTLGVVAALGWLVGLLALASLFDTRYAVDRFQGDFAPGATANAIEQLVREQRQWRAWTVGGVCVIGALLAQVNANVIRSRGASRLVATFIRLARQDHPKV
jgi:hypothetical protein